MRILSLPKVTWKRVNEKPTKMIILKDSLNYTKKEYQEAFRRYSKILFPKK